MSLRAVGLRPAAASALALLAVGGCSGSGTPGSKDAAATALRQPSSLYISSSALAEGQAMPAEYTCDGAGRSPPLTWSDAPAQTQSFALVVEDPDAPEGTFGHWGVYDIPASVHELAAGAGNSDGLKQTSNDFDRPGYGSPCPPKGDKPHHYRFRLMALDVAQLSSAPPEVKDLNAAIEDHVIGTAELTVTYQRR
jgi:Raf kinase inhibitor-like YbhB/YbcL family protein